MIYNYLLIKNTYYKNNILLMKLLFKSINLMILLSFFKIKQTFNKTIT